MVFFRKDTKLRITDSAWVNFDVEGVKQESTFGLASADFGTVRKTDAASERTEKRRDRCFERSGACSTCSADTT